MADRLKTFTSNLIRFAAGERPSADKFNAANEYLGRNIRDIFKAIGDMYGQGYPHLIDGETHLTGKWNPHQVGNDQGRALDIVNLARLIGPASNLNPKQISGIQTINEIIPAGTNEHILKYNKTELLSIPNYTRILTVTDPFTSNDQYKLIKNSILFAETTTEELSITYFINSESIQGGANYLYAGFNVIPDPNQASKLNIIVDPNDPTNYILDWSATTIEAQQSGLIDLNTTSTAGEWNQGKTATLPQWMWSGNDPLFTTGTIIPEGFLYVKNLTTNECYLSATYTFLDEYSIKISGVTLCLTDEYQIVTVGTDITTSIDDLRNKWFNHKHDGSFGEPRISVKNLVGKYLESADFEESSIPDNDFPMYLHRKGYQEDSSRRNANNAMLGSLALGQVQYNEYDLLSKILYTNEDDALEDNTGEEDPRLTRLSEKILFGSESTYIQERLGALYLQSTKQLREGIYNRTEGNLGYIPSILLKTESGSTQIQSKHVEIDSNVIFVNNNQDTNEKVFLHANKIVHSSEEKDDVFYKRNTYAKLNNSLDNIKTFINEDDRIQQLSNKDLIHGKTESLNLINEPGFTGYYIYSEEQINKTKSFDYNELFPDILSFVPKAELQAQFDADRLIPIRGLYNNNYPPSNFDALTDFPIIPELWDLDLISNDPNSLKPIGIKNIFFDVGGRTNSQDSVPNFYVIDSRQNIRYDPVVCFGSFGNEPIIRKTIDNLPCTFQMFNHGYLNIIRNLISSAYTGNLNNLIIRRRKNNLNNFIETHLLYKKSEFKLIKIKLNCLDDYFSSNTFAEVQAPGNRFESAINRTLSTETTVLVSGVEYYIIEIKELIRSTLDYVLGIMPQPESNLLTVRSHEMDFYITEKKMDDILELEIGYYILNTP